MAYSEKWAHLRTTVTTAKTFSSGRFGQSQRTIGATIREDRWKEERSLDAEKITTIQTPTMSQYFRKRWKNRTRAKLVRTEAG